MYEAFYGLKCRPFLMTTDPEFMFWSSSHSLALTMLRYGVMANAPLSVITGDVGAGKTTLIRYIMNELNDDVVVGLVSNMQEGRGDLLHWVMMALDQTLVDEPYVKTFQRFQDVVVEHYARGKRVVLIIDEAQNMSMASLEEMRMLSNINADKDELIQIVLVGQPQLRDMINRPELAQFVQRIAADFHIAPLNQDETRKYIRHRLKVAGTKHEIFPDRTCDLVFEATGGVPRLINSLCDLCLVYGFSDERKVIEEDMLRDFLAGVKRHGIFAKFNPLSAKPTLVGGKEKSGGTG